MKLFILFASLSMQALAIPSNFSLDNEKTLYIVDGDSISMQMRIKGIDTPEIRQLCQKTADKIINCGKLSKYYLKQILKDLPGKLTIKPLGVDYYQRVLVRVYKGDVNIGKYMVEQGMAWAYGNEYKRQEAIARKNKIGFWGYAQPPLEPRLWRKKHPRKF